ncbi:Serine/threonine-protein kinase PknB [Rubripirellula tenax]|uniref:Serine/threonine-protein kinase PknB n=1 Tax=Rubripirellula tenax TaxID=2528015 RepID=A0A5C6FB63_9BACT|nr:serine/threonine-protein kinase [Rubripirellula tenax]TWU59063.1 Serine/threonine-protein kinase PknB [Rubripirellula tenax]
MTTNPLSENGQSDQEFEIFSIASELPTDRRSEYLDDACAGDRDLRARVELLLERDIDADQIDFLLPTDQNLKNKIDSAGLGGAESASHRLIGRHFGPFAIQREIGRGGMGSVFLAHRTEGPEQQVAIKILRSEVDRDEMIRRFRNEAQFAAALGNHPGIASLIDAGITDDGIAYLVTDYVDGIRIDDFCDENRLSIDQRLELFLAVCDAVQFAHRSAIIHRDLKPSNLLVTADARVHLIDFGIAKLTDTLPDTPNDDTQTMFRVLTPAYASPEQARGETPTTSTDVYSLGVVLYGLLTGRSPYEVDTTDPVGLVRSLEQVQPMHPHVALSVVAAGDDGSTANKISIQRRTTPTRLRRQLAGDLGTIVMMALRKESTRRYATVDQFADDIRRLLSGHTVRACKDTLRYRVGKFVRRNRLAVTVSTMCVLMLIGGIAGTSTQWARAENERIRAEQFASEAMHEAARARTAERASLVASAESKRQAEKAKQVSDFLVGMIQQSDAVGILGYQFGSRPNQSDDPTLRDVLGRGAAMIETKLQDQPLVRAALSTEIARIYLALGSVDQAEPLLKRSHTVQQVAGDSVDLADTLATLGLTRYIQGRYDESKTRLTEAIEINNRIFGENAPETADIKLALGFVSLESCNDVEQWQAAGEILEQVVKIRRSQTQPPPYQMAMALTGQAIFQRTKAEYAKSLISLAEAGGYLALEPGGGVYAEASLLAVQATINWQAGNNTIAMQQTHEVIALTKKLLGETHPMVNYIQVDQAKRMFAAGEHETAEALLREGIESARKAYGRQPRTAFAMEALGLQLLEQPAKREEAKRLLVEASEIMTDTVGAENIRTQAMLRVVGNVARSP